MIKKLIISITMFILIIGPFVHANDLSYSAKVLNSGSKKYKAVRLTSEIYNNTRVDMADLAVYGNDNEPIPHFLNSFIESGTEEKKSYKMTLVNSFVKDEYFYYDYSLKDPQEMDVISTSIFIQTDREGFAKSVEIFGGYDNINWQKIQDDIVYNVDGNEKMEIFFGGIEKYTYYRFKISNNLEKISFTSVELRYNKVLQKREYFKDTIKPKFNIREIKNRTVIDIPEFKNLKLISVTLLTDSMFKRNVIFNGISSKMLYNLDFENTKYRDLTIPLDKYRVTSDSAEIIIENWDDKPINIQGIEAEYLVDELIFEDKKSPYYTIRFGNSEIQRPKSYDIYNYKEQILNEGYDILSMGDISPQAISPKPQYDYKLIFNVAISVVALIMGIIIFLKIRK